MKQKLLLSAVMFSWVAGCTLADILIKDAGRIGGWRFFLATALYAASALPAVFVFRSQHFGWVTIMWNAAGLCLSMLVSVRLYAEPFTTRRAVAALLLLGAMLIVD